MYCMNCGKQSDDTLLVCPHCGYDLTVSGTSAAPSPNAIEAFRRRTAGRASSPSGPTPPQESHQEPAVQEFVWNNDRKSSPDTASRRGSDTPKTIRAGHDEEKKKTKDKPKEKSQHSGKPQSKKKKEQKSRKQHSRKEKGGGILSAVKLLIGIVSISLCLVLTYQAWAAGSIDAAAENPAGLFSSAQLVFAGGLLLAGVLGIATRHSRLGGMAAGLLYLATAVYGFAGMGLGGIVWPLLSLVFAVLFFATSIKHSGKTRERVREEKSPFFGKLLLAVVFLVVGALIGAAVFVMLRGRGDDLTGLTYGDRFVFDELEITIGRAVEWDVLENEYSIRDGAGVFRLPLAIKNLRDEPHTLDFLYYTQVDPSGTAMDKIGGSFPDDILTVSGIEPGDRQNAYMHFLYNGDGEYRVELESPSGESAQIVLPVTGPESEPQPEPEPESQPDPESEPEPSAPASSVPESSAADSSSEAPSQSESSSQPASSAAEPESEVTVIVPALFADDEITKALTTEDEATGVKSVRRSADGTTAVVLTESGHAALKAAAERDVRDYIARMERNYSTIEEVFVNSAMTESTVTVYRDDFERSGDGRSLDGLFFAVGYCHILNGRTDVTFTVWLEEESTGMAYQVLDYPDDLYWFR